MLTGYILFASIVLGAQGMTFINTYYSGNQIIVGNHSIRIVTEPIPKLYIDDELINLTTAGVKKSGDGFTLYSDFPNLPGLSVKFYDNGGYTVYYESNGSVSTFGTLSEEEQKRLNEKMAQTFRQVNDQVSRIQGQVQQQIGNMMQSLNNMFSQPGWPFVG